MMYGDIVLHISFMVWFGLDWIGLFMIRFVPCCLD